MPFPCYLCEMSFATRIECLQHQAQAHAADWQALQEKNAIGNVAVFATRLDKGIIKICKKGKDIMDKLAKSKTNEDGKSVLQINFLNFHLRLCNT